MSVGFAPFIFVFILLLIAGAFVFGALLLRSGRGAPSLSEPRCAKCNYDLRGFSGTAPVRCSECGADLTVQHAVLWGKYQPRPRRLWTGLAVILLPIVLLAMLVLGVKAVAVRRMGGNSPGSPGFASRSNAQVIASLATSANTPWDWQELERRLAAGTLSNAEAGQAIDKLIAFLNAQPTIQPLNWAEGFLTKADAAGKITPQQYERLAKAFYKPCTVAMAGTARAGAKVPVTVHGGGPWPLPGCEFVYALRQVTIDGGGTLDVISDQDPNRPKPNPDYLSGKAPWQITGKAILKLPPGNHTLVFTIDAALLVVNTAPLAVNNLPGQAAGWPKGRAAWTEVVSVPIIVVPADQSPIATVADPKLDPNTTGAVKINTIRVIREGSGGRLTVDMAINGNIVPCSFDITLRIGGKDYPIGSYVASKGGSIASGLSLHMEKLDAAVQTADVLLRPNPAHAEGTVGVDRVWGGPVDVLGVPVQRYDLQGK